MAEFVAPVTEALLRALAPGRDDVVLELGAGTGELAARLAPRVKHVICTDLSPAMVDAARRRGVAGVEHRVLDMQAIDLPDGSVDAVLCRFGYMLVPDPPRAMRETKRVLRPGGRLAFATWAAARHNPWSTMFGPVLVERGLMEPPRAGEPGQFALGEPELVADLARRTGFAEVEVDEVPVESRFSGWDDYRSVITAMAATLREVLEGLDEETHAEVDAAARLRLEPFRRNGEYVLPGVALVTRAI